MVRERVQQQLVDGGRRRQSKNRDKMAESEEREEMDALSHRLLPSRSRGRPITLLLQGELGSSTRVGLQENRKEPSKRDEREPLGV